jgi:hypothetical protein
MSPDRRELLEYENLKDQLQGLRASLEPRRPRNGQAFRAIKAEIRNVEKKLTALALTGQLYEPEQEGIREWRPSEKQPPPVKHQAPLFMTDGEKRQAASLKSKGRCEVCGTAPPMRRDLHVDHDHGTGRYRGVLCRDCNLALGLLKDSPARMEKLARYVLRDVM